MNLIYICYYNIEYEGISIDFATTDKDKAFDTSRLKTDRSFNRYPDVKPEIDVYDFDGNLIEEYWYKRSTDEWIKYGGSYD